MLQIELTYLSEIGTISYRELLLDNKNNLNRLSKGVVAPNFILEDANENSIQLNDFKGNYVLLDIWASWCGPCIHEAPYFEKKALKHKGKPIKFFAVGTDEKRANWLVSINKKSKTIPQYWVKNRALFSKLYDVKTIPRFILIDDQGILLDVDFERLSSKNFDELLNMHLPKNK